MPDPSDPLIVWILTGAAFVGLLIAAIAFGNAWERDDNTERLLASWAPGAIALFIRDIIRGWEHTAIGRWALGVGLLCALAALIAYIETR